MALGCKIYFSLHPEKMERFRAELAEVQKAKAALPYRARPSLLTPAELKFHEALRPLVTPHWHLFSKVRMEDILEVKPGLEKKEAYGYRSRIKSRHIDFVLCDMESLEVLITAHSAPSLGSFRSSCSTSWWDSVAASLPL